jgi:hypothetical protein
MEYTFVFWLTPPVCFQLSPFGSSLWICGDFYPEDVGIGVDFFRKTCFYGEGSYTFVGGV